MPKSPFDRFLQHLPRSARILLDWLIGIAIAVAIVLAIRAWVVTPYAIPTASMEPTLHCAPSGVVQPAHPSASIQPGQNLPSPHQAPVTQSLNGCEGSSFLGFHFSDRVLVSRLTYDFRSPRRGDIVVFTPPASASQICGHLDTNVLVKRLIGLPGDKVIENSGFIYINGKKLNEPYVKPDRRDARSGIWHVPKGHYFFMGDNRLASCDSRDWGSVPRKALIGPVFMTYWPPNRISFR
ncbi:MAG: signal peptidase I [Gaiellaceae bacterium]|jgi:signal peptidase I